MDNRKPSSALFAAPAAMMEPELFDECTVVIEDGIVVLRDPAGAFIMAMSLRVLEHVQQRTGRLHG